MRTAMNARRKCNSLCRQLSTARKAPFRHFHSAYISASTEKSLLSAIKCYTGTVPCTDRQLCGVCPSVQCSIVCIHSCHFVVAISCATAMIQLQCSKSYAFVKTLLHRRSSSCSRQRLLQAKVQMLTTVTLRGDHRCVAVAAHMSQQGYWDPNRRK